MKLERLLQLVPRVYSELTEAAVPVRSGEPSDRSPDPREKPAPARLDVTDHRHLLRIGLRWWVDAVTDPDDLPAAKLGDSPGRMCAWLLAHLADGRLAGEDADELRSNLQTWLEGAWNLLGPREAGDPPPLLPRESLERRVPVHVAAQALGVSVSTVKRRAVREAGTVVLRDAAGPPCDQSGLPEPWCSHCRPPADCASTARCVTPAVAQ